ncbi:MAG: dTDP-4-dehydrorhamnose reductase, partial [Actinomycetaceae bacterium]|nr:dTDP-4-dehydrorhamnose reductase [Actinomycetaceae bacterium]
RWVITGANGMLGHDLMERVRQEGHEAIGLDLPEIDITDEASVARAIESADVIANVAAYTAVDAAEENENIAFTVNAVGPQILARHAKKIGARLIHISTDYVFGGEDSEPYTENGAMAPKGAYGRTKAAGEWAVRANTDNYLIVRTAWLYGKNGKSFPATMKALSETHETLSVVTDEVGQPTWTVDLADLLVRLVEAQAPSGTYHGTSSGQTNWWGFTRLIMETLGKDPDMVKETTAAAFKRPAPRPHYSVLSHKALEDIGVAPIGGWDERWRAAKPVMFD